MASCLAILIFFIPFTVFANDIESISIEATIHQDGSATIRENRVFNVSDGTEHYIVVGNLGDSELTDYKVFDSQGNELQFVDNWDVDWSRQEKAGKYGIIDTGDGYELSFGYGEYGRHDFTVEYKITDFIYNLEDGNQAVYWRFVNDDMDPVSQVDISVTNDIGYEFIYPQVRIWGFGFEGTTAITSERLSMETNTFSRSDYMVMLSIFDGQIFNTNKGSDWTSDSLIDQAFEGVDVDPKDYQDGSTNESFEDDTSSSSSSGGLFASFLTGGIFSVAMLLYIVGMVYIVGVTAFRFIFGIKGAPTAYTAEKYKKPKDLGYHRQIPFEDFLLTSNIVKPEPKNVISAYILKWLFEGRLEDSSEEVGFIFKRDALALIIKDKPELEFSNNEEKELWGFLKASAGSDMILSEEEFNRYIRKNPSKMTSWIKDAFDYSYDFLKDNGYYEMQTRKILFKEYSQYNLSDKGQKLGDMTFGFKNYLKDFSIIEEREAKEVMLWQEYLIWAAYLGIAEEVYEQLKIVDPNIVNYNTNLGNTIILTNTFSNSAQSAYTSATSSSSGSSFSGGGGSSFGGGGGGGSGGGGSGGGSR